MHYIAADSLLTSSEYWVALKLITCYSEEDFNDLLLRTRKEVDTIMPVQNAWEAYRYWTIDMDKPRRVPVAGHCNSEADLESDTTICALDDLLLDTLI